MQASKTVRVARCNSCGLIFPEDYFDNWGKKYGIGLGPSPVCEGMRSCYDQKPIPDGVTVSSASQIMFPLHVCRGTVSIADVTQEEADEKAAILAIDDPGMRKRGPMMREHQIQKSTLIDTIAKQLKL